MIYFHSYVQALNETNVKYSIVKSQKEINPDYTISFYTVKTNKHTIFFNCLTGDILLKVYNHNFHYIKYIKNKEVKSKSPLSYTNSINDENNYLNILAEIMEE
jgi:hypothetical protein